MPQSIGWVTMKKPLRNDAVISSRAGILNEPQMDGNEA